MADESIGTVFVDLVLNKGQLSSGLKDVASQGKQSARELEMSFANTLAALTSGFRQFAAYAGVALGTGALIAYAKNAALLAARVDTLSIVMKEVGKNAGYTSSQMLTYVHQTEKMGITTKAAMDSVIKMAQAEMNLAQASQFARVAQDAAVIGNINSSEAFQRMIYAVKTGQPEMLRTIGLNVSFEAAYGRLAGQLRKNTTALTESEKVQARMNATLEYGTRIQGVYEASLGTAGKAMLSLERYTEQLQLKLGSVFQPALKITVDALTEAFKGMGNTVDDFIASGAMEDLATSLAKFTAQGIKGIGAMMSAVTDLVKVLYEFKAVLLIIGGIIVGGKLLAYFGLIVARIKDVALAVKSFTEAMAFMGALKFAAMGAGVTTLSGSLLTFKNVLSGLIGFIGPIKLLTGAIALLGYTGYQAYKAFTEEVYDSEKATAHFMSRLKKMNEVEAKSEFDFVKAQMDRLNQLKELAKSDPKAKTTFNVLGGDKAMEDLKYFEATLKAKFFGIEQEKKIAAERKKLNEEEKKRQQEERDKPQRDKQRSAADLAIAKSDSAAMLDEMRSANNMELELLKNAGADKAAIAERNKQQIIDIAWKEYDESIRLAKMSADIQQKERAGAFERQAFLEERENAAKNKRDQTILQAGARQLADSLNEESGVRKAHFDFQHQQATEFSQMYSDILAKGRALDIERMKVQGYSEGRISQAARDAAIENAKRDRDESIRLAKEDDDYKKTLSVGRVERELALNAAISRADAKFLADKRNIEQSFDIESLQRKARDIADYKSMMIDLASFDKNEWDNRRENTDRWAIEQRDIIYRVFGSWKDASYELGKLDAAIAEQKKNIRISELKEQEDYFNQVGGFSKQAYDLRIERINLEADEVSKATGNDTLRMRYLEDQTKIAFRNAALAGDSFFNGVKAGFTQLSNEKETWGKLGDAMGGIFKDSLSRNLGNSIYDIFTGKTTDIGMIGQKIADDMLRGFSQKLGGMAADWLTKEYFDPWTASIGKVFSGVWDLAKTGYKAVVDYVASTEWGKAFGGMIKTFTSYLGDMLDAAIRFVKEVLVEWGILSAAKPVAGALSGITGGGINPLGVVGTATSLYGTGASLYGSITGGTSAISAGIEGMSSMAPSAYYGTLTGTVGGAPTLGGGASFLSGTSTTGTSALSSVGAAAAPFAAAAALGSLVQAFPDVFGIGGGDVQYSPGAAYTPEGLAANWAMYSMGGGHLGALNQIGTFKAMGWQPPEEVATMYTQRIMDAIPSVAALIFDGNMWRLSGKFAFPESSAADRFLSQFINDPGWDYQKGLYYGSQPAPWGEYAAGGYSDRAAIFGEKGGEWAVPAYSPEKEDFLESTGVADKIRQVLLETKGESNESPTNIQIFFDGYEVLSAMVDAADKNPRLHAKLRG